MYVGLNLETGGLMAVKHIQVHSGVEVAPAMAELEHEVRMLSALRNPNIVRYLGMERDEGKGQLFIFTEWVPGGSIASLLRTFGRLSEGVVRSYTQQILTGLQYLHQNNVVHRDIKVRSAAASQLLRSPTCCCGRLRLEGCQHIGGRPWCGQAGGLWGLTAARQHARK